MAIVTKKSSSRGVVHQTDIRCAKCLSPSLYQEWIEQDAKKGVYKRYGVIFCSNSECDNKTSIHSERTAAETKQECIYEWIKINKKIADTH